MYEEDYEWMPEVTKESDREVIGHVHQGGERRKERKEEGMAHSKKEGLRTESIKSMKPSASGWSEMKNPCQEESAGNRKESKEVVTEREHTIGYSKPSLSG